MLTKIYLITNINDDPNNVYIGKTKGNRERDHIHTYGNNITYVYIDEINSLDREDWEPLETYWIEQFKAWGFNIINKRKKGGSGVNFHSEETKQKLRKPKPKGFGFNIGNFHKGRKRSDETKRKMSIIKKGKNSNACKTILQYDINNNLIKEWPSLKKAGDELKINSRSIGNCINKISKTSGGYIWENKLDNNLKFVNHRN